MNRIPRPLRLGPSRRQPAPGHPPSSVTSLYDEQLFARLRNLVIRSRHLSASGLSGEHRSKRRGLSPEFSDFKPYSPGDDFRRIDWKTYARFDELFVRESETTTEYDLHLLIDASPSMDWSGDESRPTKLRYAQQLAGALAYLSLWHFDRVTVGPIHTPDGKVFGPIQGRNQIAPVFRYVERLQTAANTGEALAPSLARYVHARSRPGILIVISDCLDDDPHELERSLRNLAARGWETTLVRIEDPAEVDPALLIEDGVNLELADRESGLRMDVHGAQATFGQYREDRAAWSAAIDLLGVHQGTTVISARTDETVDSLIFTRLRALGVVR
ncbi:MAG TPA: DUF58 domain-containing protein [Thermomicrobiales bacterium]|nr:DUF58 domain-containing protein [Thermomicrobiales bacterium]